MTMDDYILVRGALDATAGEAHAWGTLNIVSDRSRTGLDGVTAGMARIAPGEANPLHVHGNCSEIVLLLRGAVEHVVGGEVVELSAGDVLIVPRGIAHQARNHAGVTAEMVVVYDAGERGFEAIG